jgi:hypothetical protein
VIDDDCVDTVDRDYELTAPFTTTVEFMVSQCRINGDECTKLCRAALEQHDILMKEPTRCDVSIDDDRIGIEVSFEVTSNRSDCSVFPEPPVFDIGRSDGPQVRGALARTF